MNTDLSKAVTLTKPDVSIPWFSDEESRRQGLIPVGFQENNDGQYISFFMDKVTFLEIDDLYISLRYDLSPGNLTHIEFMYVNSDFIEKLESINKVLESHFGPKTERLSDGMLSVAGWELAELDIETYIWPSAWGEITMLVLRKAV